MLDTSLNKSQQRALAAKMTNSVLGCISRSAASRSRGVTLLLSTGEATPGVQGAVLGSQYEAHMDILERVTAKGHKEDRSICPGRRG